MYSFAYISSFANIICWKDCLFPHWMLLAPLSKIRIFGIPWNLIWILSWIFLFLQKKVLSILNDRTLGSTVISTELSLPTHEHRCLSTYLCLWFLSVMFRNFLLYKSPWLISKYCILFDAIVNEIVFLISFSACSLLVYRSTTNFFKQTYLFKLVSSEVQLIFACWFSILQPCWICLLLPMVDLWEL